MSLALPLRTVTEFRRNIFDSPIFNDRYCTYLCFFEGDRHDAHIVIHDANRISALFIRCWACTFSINYSIRSDGAICHVIKNTAVLVMIRHSTFAGGDNPAKVGSIEIRHDLTRIESEEEKERERAWMRDSNTHRRDQNGGEKEIQGRNTRRRREKRADRD